MFPNHSNNSDISSVCYVTTEEELQATTARAKIAIVPLQTELNSYNIVDHIETGTDLNIQSATRCNPTTNECSKVGNLPTYETVSLQDTVKTYMLSSSYPHQISLDEIERVCKLPIMRIQVSASSENIILPPPRPSVRNCSVVIRPLDEHDLSLWQKPPTMNEELDPNSLQDLNETPIEDIKSPKRYPTRYECVKRVKLSETYTSIRLAGITYSYPGG